VSRECHHDEFRELIIPADIRCPGEHDWIRRSALGCESGATLFVPLHGSHKRVHHDLDVVKIDGGRSEKPESKEDII